MNEEVQIGRGKRGRRAYSFDQIAMALLLVDNGMTAEQKGQFIGVSVSWWCPQHQVALHAGVSEK